MTDAVIPEAGVSPTTGETSRTDGEVTGTEAEPEEVAWLEHPPSATIAPSKATADAPRHTITVGPGVIRR